MDNLGHRKNNFSFWLCLIPLCIGFLFAALMFCLALILTEDARNHYQSKKLQESIQGISQINIMPKMPAFPGDKTTPTPAPLPTPKPEKDWRKKIGDYEISLPMTALPMLIFGLRLTSIAFGSLPARIPLGFGDLTWRSLLLMVCSFIISPALLILYLWVLRIGLIG